jgi:ribonuclease-3
LLIRILGLPVKESLRIEEALTHRSASHERGRKNPVPNYERLEFLGDRVIGLIVSEYLLNTWPAANEGDIGQIFSSIVSTQVLASIARRMDLGAFMILGKGSHSSGDRDNPSILADTLESLTACLYLEYGLETVRQILIPWFAQPLREIVIGLEQANVVKEAKSVKERKEPEVLSVPPRRPPSLNYKMLVQKWCQRIHGVQPEYRVIEEVGPPHQRRFRVGAFVKEEVLATGETTTKRGASILAAKNAWETISSKDDVSVKDADAGALAHPVESAQEVVHDSSFIPGNGHGTDEEVQPPEGLLQGFSDLHSPPPAEKNPEELLMEQSVDHLGDDRVAPFEKEITDQSRESVQGI